MPAKPASATAPAPSSPAGELLDQLLAAIQQPTANDLAGTVAGVETALKRRSVDAPIRSEQEVKLDLDHARKAVIKAEFGSDEAAHKEAADRVSTFERELAEIPIKREALAELGNERRDAVDAAHAALSTSLSTYRANVGEAAKALEAEALRLWSIAATARKLTETTASRFDQFGLLHKTHAMEEVIGATRSMFPPAWSDAMGLWWRTQEWLCRP